jgi:hypothetical protein
MSKNRRYWIFAVNAAVAAVAVGLVVFSLLPKQSDAKACGSVGVVHELTLRGDAFSQPELTLARCDVIKIVNNDTQSYQLNFGVHDKHIPYPGFTTQLLGPNKAQRVDALQTGEYELHDHLRDNAKLNLSIRNR